MTRYVSGRSVPRMLLCCGLLPCVAAMLGPVAADNGRTPIPFVAPVTFPIVIDTPGSYVLTRNLTDSGAGSAVIQVLARGVTLDLNGKQITADPLAEGVLVGVGAQLTLRNGSIVGGLNGIRAITASDVVIEDIRISGAARRGISLEGSDTAIVRRNTIENTADAAIGAEGFGIVDPPTQAIIEDNVITRTADGICMFRGGAGRIVNNSLRDLVPGPFSVGILAESVDGVLVRDNTLERMTVGNGIRILQGSGNRVTGNLLSNVSGGEGIVVEFGGGNLVSGNVVRGSEFVGLFVLDSRENVIEDNALTGNGSWGLLISGSSQGNFFRRNTARGNGGDPSGCGGETATADACDIGTDNVSAGDNFMPARI